MINKQKLENLTNDFSLEKLSDFLWDANFTEDEEDFSFLNSEDIFSEVQKIGEIETKEDNKKIVVTVIKVNQDLSERSSRKKQYDLGKKILTKQDNYEAGIFVFYDNHGSFRFSLIYPTYSGTKRILNFFKRYTYFVDPNLTNKTFLKQIGEGNFDSLENIKEAFSVEKVTKEFFKEYKNLFEELVRELDKNYTFKNEATKYNINTENFAKKLLGQIVFLYFLQKKCWIGAPKNKSLKQGDNDFLRNLFRKKYREYNNFFNDILEHLFYGALNKKSDKAGTFYRDYFKCQIPFLNGGLFDPEYDWQETNIILDDKIFERILEVFNRYNFTVDENSPMDQEIAIDPEMLGKVFENLLSENLRKGKGTYYTPREIVYYMCQESLINYLSSVIPAEAGIQSSAPTQKNITTLIKHNETKDNSQIPKTISQNAKLIDEKLASIKVCDPACGSGAFLVGMMNGIIKARQILQPFLNKKISEYDLKKETIQNCIYGVDIDPGAIEIAKLRLWLSLVVDYDLEEIEPLPNLDYKIMQGNSLLEEFEGVKFYEDENNLYKQLDNLKEHKKEIEIERNKNQKKVLDYYKINYKQDKQLEKETTKLAKESENIQKNIIELQKHINVLADNTERKAQKEELKNKKIKYFSESDGKEKDKLKQEISDLIDWFVKSALEEEKNKLKAFRKNEEEKSRQIVSEKDRKNYYNQWSGKFLKEGKIDELLEKIHDPKMEKPFFLWKLNFMEVFENGGFDVVIGNPPYVQMQKFSRQDIQKQYEKAGYQTFKKTGDIYALFYERGLEMSKKDTGLLCYITSNKWMRAGYGESLRKYFSEKNPLQLLDFGGFKVFESATVDTNILLVQNADNKNKLQAVHFKNDFKKDSQISKYFENNKTELKNLSSDTWFIGSKAEIDLKKKIEEKGLPLKDWDVKIYRGILTGFNEAFIIDEKTRNELIASDSKSEEIIKLILRGRDIKRYGYEWAGLYLINSHNGLKTSEGKIVLPVDIKNYPAIKNHLDKFWSNLKKRQDQGLTPYNLRDCAYIEEFEKEKIVFKAVGRNLTFSLLEKGKYITAPASFMTSSCNKYILSILCSSFSKYFIYQNADRTGAGDIMLNVQSFEKIPIPKISPAKQKPFVKLVDQILEKKKDNPEADISDLEKKIDGMVYGLYELSEEEIEIVESRNK